MNTRALVLMLNALHLPFNDFFSILLFLIVVAYRL